MKIIISFIYLISLFSYAYAQNETPADKENKTEVQITTNYESLTKNLGNWKSVTLNFRYDFSRRQVLYGSYEKAYRANISSDQATIGLYQPLSKRFTLNLETSVSPEHKFLPKWSGLAQIETKLSSTVFLNTGYRRTNYEAVKLNVFNIGVEKYWKAYRFVYNASLANGKNLGNSFSNRIQADRYYGERANYIGADFSFGNEVSSILNDGKVLKSKITSVSVGGKHWLTNNFGINYRASFYKQGDFYSRGGTTLGAIFRF